MGSSWRVQKLQSLSTRSRSLCDTLGAGRANQLDHKCVQQPAGLSGVAVHEPASQRHLGIFLFCRIHAPDCGSRFQDPTQSSSSCLLSSCSASCVPPGCCCLELHNMLGSVSHYHATVQLGDVGRASARPEWSTRAWEQDTPRSTTSNSSPRTKQGRTCTTEAFVFVARQTCRHAARLPSCESAQRRGPGGLAIPSRLKSARCAPPRPPGRTRAPRWPPAPPTA